MRIKLKDAFNLQMGKTPARADLSLWGGSNKWISIADIGSAKKYISTTKECITDEGVSRSGIKVVPKGTVIMSFKLSIGKTAIVSEDMYTNEAIMAFIDNGTHCIDPNYLYHLCCGIDWTQGGNKAVMGLTLNKATLSEMEIELPTIEKQREIASILDQLDAIIEKRHDELDMIKQLVKSRFVELFGDPATNPMGWTETTLGEECYYIKDGPHKSLPDVGKGNGYPFISVRNIVNGYIDFSTAKYISERDYLDSIKKCHPQKGDMLYSKGGTTGIAKLIDVDIEFANWVHVAVLKFRDSLNGVFFEKMLNSDYCYDQSQKLTKGVANRDLVLSAMAKIRIYKPPFELQAQFATFVEQTDKSKYCILATLIILRFVRETINRRFEYDKL